MGPVREAPSMRDQGNGEWLRGLEVFGDCDDACTARLLGQLRLERYQEGDVIVSGCGAESVGTVRIIKQGCVEVCERSAGSQHVSKEVLADGEFFGALPALGVAHRMGAMLVRAMGHVECFALSDETVRSVLAGGARPVTGSAATSSRAVTAEPSARGGTADCHATWGGRSGKMQPTSGSAVLPAAAPKTTPRQRLPSSLKSGVASAADEALSAKNLLAGEWASMLAGDWASVEVHKVHADSWQDPSRSADNDELELELESSLALAVAPSKGSTMPSSSTTPCKPSTPCSRRQQRAFRRPVLCSSAARPCSRKKEDVFDVATPSVPGTPSMIRRRSKAGMD